MFMNVFLALWIAIGLLLHGCGSDPKPMFVDAGVVIRANQERDTGESNAKVLRVAVGAMVSPKRTFVHYQRLLNYLGSNVGEKISLVQRKTYTEINQGLASGIIDLAFICSGPYVIGRKNHDFSLIAVPQVRGKITYQSYLIVNSKSHFNQLEDLRGRAFAFTDPYSNTGRFVPLAWLSEIGQTPETFFGSTLYTYGHDNSILAVSRNLVDAAAVDGLVWDYFHEKLPEMVADTRVIRRSDEYGIPPVVCSSLIAPERQTVIRSVLLNMHNDQRGQEILREILIDKFVLPDKGLYDSLEALFHAVR